MLAPHVHSHISLKSSWRYPFITEPGKFLFSVLFTENASNPNSKLRFHQQKLHLINSRLYFWRSFVQWTVTDLERVQDDVTGEYFDNCLMFGNESRWVMLLLSMKMQSLMVSCRHDLRVARLGIKRGQQDHQPLSWHYGLLGLVLLLCGLQRRI